VRALPFRTKKHTGKLDGLLNLPFGLLGFGLIKHTQQDIFKGHLLRRKTHKIIWQA
jgi:hypothetical protein